MDNTEFQTTSVYLGMNEHSPSQPLSDAELRLISEVASQAAHSGGGVGSGRGSNDEFINTII